MKVYLDNAASTAPDPEVLRAMYEVMENHYGNPSSIHSHGREARSLVERARKTVARLLHTSPSELFFTSGGTEADNTAIVCGIESLGIRHAITSKIEHHAVLHTLEALARKGSIRLSYVHTDPDGSVDPQHLRKLLESNDRSFVSLMHANNEIGTLLDLEEAAAICREFDAVFHSDTVQTLGHLPIDLSRPAPHFITGAAHKLHGPKGVGFLYVSHRIKVQPFIYGGSQERNMRGGTENIYGIVGLARALEIACANMEKDRRYIQGLKSYMIENLKERIPGIKINGPAEASRSLYTILNVSFPETEIGEMLLFNLDINGISASGGSACSSGSEIGSHVLAELHADPRRPSVRFSFSKYNTREDIDYAVEKLREVMHVEV